jgi:hypothetical protein
MAQDDYQHTLGDVAKATATLADDKGSANDGYGWWNLAYPTLMVDRADHASDPPPPALYL